MVGPAAPFISVDSQASNGIYVLFWLFINVDEIVLIIHFYFKLSNNKLNSRSLFPFAVLLQL